MLSLVSTVRWFSFGKIQNSVSQNRSFFTSRVRYGKRNFRKFQIPNIRGNADDLRWLQEHPEEYDHRGQRPYGIRDGLTIIPVREMTPELIVPDLKNFKLKPYVSYKAQEVVQEKFTAEHLFYAVYAKKIAEDFKEGNLDEEGNSLEPSEDEKMTPEMAFQRARQTGSDIYG